MANKIISVVLSCHYAVLLLDIRGDIAIFVNFNSDSVGVAASLCSIFIGSGFLTIHVLDLSAIVSLPTCNGLLSLYFNSFRLLTINKVCGNYCGICAADVSDIRCLSRLLELGCENRDGYRYKDSRLSTNQMKSVGNSREKEVTPLFSDPPPPYVRFYPTKKEPRTSPGSTSKLYFYLCSIQESDGKLGRSVDRDLLQNRSGYLRDLRI